ncbi:MAG: DEAD/DEAH box helicase [Planctomycetota bacterium]
MPKHRGELLATAAAVSSMGRGEVERTRYPRNPLDVLAQQIVAAVAMDPLPRSELLDLVRGAAPFADLPESAFDGVLDMLSGRYPSDDFAELRPRIEWDRATDRLEARRGAQRIALTSGGTIPDRGLYRVHLVGEDGRGRGRIGELDEEMVFESRVGEIFRLGASTWRIEEITTDAVLVSPAPGEAGKMPFWRGEGPGRPVDFGRAMGALARRLETLPEPDARRLLAEDCGFDEAAVANLRAHLDDQRACGSAVPTDRRIVLERFLDEVGDWRVLLLSPFGSRVHVPWATAVRRRIADWTGGEVDELHSDDGILFRFPGASEPPPPELFLPDADEAEEIVLREVSGTARFATAFRDAASRSLLLPRRRPGERTPLWLQRRKSASLLAVVSRFEDFPVVFEAHRECLRDDFDLPAFREILRGIRDREIEVALRDTDRASPYASSLMFAYTAAFLYDGDQPLADRRAQILSLDQDRLRELLGEAELRALLDPAAIDEVEASLQGLDLRRPPRDADELRDLLRTLGDLTREEIAARGAPEDLVTAGLDELVARRRVLRLRIAGEERYAIAEEAGRYRDALGAPPPPGLPEAFLESPARPLQDLVSRHARRHGPFTADEVASRLGIGVAPVRTELEALEREGRVASGEFRPTGRGREWCDREVLRRIKRLSLARARKEIAPVAPEVYARFLAAWQGVDEPRPGAAGRAPARASHPGPPQRARDRAPAGARGRPPTRRSRPSPRDRSARLARSRGRGAARRPDRAPRGRGRGAPRLGSVRADATPRGPRRGGPARTGRLLLADLEREVGGYPDDLVEALWDLVWAGRARSDTLAALRSRLRASTGRRPTPRRREGARAGWRAALRARPGTEGRWSLTPAPAASPTERAAARAELLLATRGVVSREVLRRERIPGGFSALHPVLVALEERGRARRGWFVEGLGASQFAGAGAASRLRSMRDEGRERALVLAATDPAAPWGDALPWPETPGPRPARTGGALVVAVGGRCVLWIAPGGRGAASFVGAEDEDARPVWRAAAEALARRGRLRLETLDGESAASAPRAVLLREAGFRPDGAGLVLEAGNDARG